MSASVKLRASPSAVRVDRARGVIYGATIATATEARGHGFALDMVSLQQIVKAINAAVELPVRCVHPNDGEDPLPRLCGSIRNARLNGAVVRGDVYLFEHAKDRDFILEVCEKLPEAIALSIEFKPDYVDGATGRIARVLSVSAVDFVGIGAVTPRGILKKGTIMEELISFLRGLGMPESVTDEGGIIAWLKEHFAPAGNPDEDNGSASMSAAGGASLALKAVQAERARVKQIRGLAAAMKCPVDFADRMVDSGASVEQAGQQAVQLRMRMDALTTPTGSPIRMSDNTNNGDVLQAATLLHLGRARLAEKDFKPHILQAARRLNVRTAEDLARESVRLSGRGDTLGKTSAEVVRLAFSSMSLPETLGSSLDRVVAEAYAAQPATWRSWAGVKSASSFREHKALRPYISSSDLEEVGAGGTIKHGSLEEETYSFQVHTVAKMLSLTRQAVVNDSLGLLADMAAELGRQAPRAINDALYTLLLDNTGSFFSAGNGNLEDGNDSVLTFDGLAAAVTNLRKRRDADNRVIGLTPAVLLVSPELEVTALQLVNSPALSRADDQDNEPTGNPYYQRLTVEVEPRLSDTTFHASASTTLWFLLCDANNPNHVVAFLDGKEMPTVETQDADFNTLGISMRAYLDFGVAQADFRTGVMNAGA